MATEVIAIVSCVFVATSIVALVHEQRMDVLHGSYIEGQKNRRSEPAKKRVASVAMIVDRFRWKTRFMVYLTSIIAC